MRAVKRLRTRHADPSPQPASKKPKRAHEPGLDFLVNEDARAGRKLDAKLTNGLARAKANKVDESQALLAAQDDGFGVAEDLKQPLQKKKTQEEIISISSSDELSDAEDDEQEGNVPETGEEQTLANGHVTGRDDLALSNGKDQEMEDADATQEPTFGDLLQAQHPEPIDVQKSLQSQAGAPDDLVVAGSRRPLQPPTAGSLGTVLTQALKTNDKDLLESCFAMVDVLAIRATIQRQHSQQIATLLERIAERIHKRPGRAGRLMVWIQWSLVTHGGYLANQPELMKKLKALAQVTRERANGLQPLLHLKGKLDLLSAQLEARRNMQAASRAANAEDMDDEQEVLYIEGQDDAWSSDDEPAGRNARNRTKSLPRARADGSDEELGNDEDLPNGYINGIEEDASEDDEDGDRLLDDEAEEVSDEEPSSNEEAESDASSVDDDESSEDEDEEVAVKQPKPQTLNRKR